MILAGFSPGSPLAILPGVIPEISLIISARKAPRILPGIPAGIPPGIIQVITLRVTQEFPPAILPDTFSEFATGITPRINR